MLIYTPDSVFEAAQKVGLKGELNSFLERIRGVDDHLVARSFLEPVHPLHKKRLGKFRLIGRFMEIDDEWVLVCHALWSVQDTEYKGLMLNAQGTAKALVPDNSELQTWLEGQEREESKATRKEVPEELTAWLQPPNWGDEVQASDVIVYELHSWTEQLGQEDFARWWRDVFSLLNIAADREDGEPVDDSEEIRVIEIDNLAILFQRIAFPSAPEALVLIAPSTDWKGDRNRIIEHTVTDAAAKLSEVKTPEDLASLSARTYPDYMLSDPQCWYRIESDGMSGADGLRVNLALSAEEQNLLHAISSPRGDRLPVFINGRAGSGKSLMLHYLFAHYCGMRARGVEGKPVYLTYNAKLCELARETVLQILSSHYRFLQERTNAQPPAGLGDLLKPYFRTFHDFLLDLVPKAERTRFDKEQATER